MPMVSYRSLLPMETERIAAHLARLPPDDRRRRFFGQLSGEAAALHARQIDWRHTVAIGAFEHGVLRGVAELSCLDRSCELAVSVEPHLQRHGVGTELVDRALLAARNHRMGRISVEWLHGNAGMSAITAKLAARRHIAGDEESAEIEIAAPSHASVLREWTGEAWGWLSDLTDRMAGFGLPAKAG